ncbi:MAG: hypothetical protein KatS3mg010_0252 [Acidimicrobiia bacterium]|nr:MAG: hypothetical protein KatS3mg010_0252 [Acidimicrobiia bacterium]
MRGEDRSERFRVVAQPLPDGRTRLLAVPLDDVDDTLRRLLAVEIVVAAAVLTALSVLGWWALKVGLRPLERMEETAGAIAAGDLSRRVDDVDERTEAGRLGMAFNTMLARIEDAFAQREASETRLRRFVADASHELRTPLTSIRGYSELFRRGADANPEDLEKAMRRIEDEAKRMGVLVDDLLLLARLDQGQATRSRAGRSSSRSRVTPSRTRARRTPTTTSRSAPWRSARWSRATSCDSGRCSRTSWRTRAPTRHRARRSPSRSLPGDDGVVVEVADDGPGLTREEAAHVFERFWRADTSRARASGGSGLGLSIVAAIAEAHGGRAEVESAPGAGATFRVWLPTATGDPG